MARYEAQEWRRSWNRNSVISALLSARGQGLRMSKCLEPARVFTHSFCGAGFSPGKRKSLSMRRSFECSLRSSWANPRIGTRLRSPFLVFVRMSALLARSICGQVRLRSSSFLMPVLNARTIIRYRALYSSALHVASSPRQRDSALFLLALYIPNASEFFKNSMLPKANRL